MVHQQHRPPALNFSTSSPARPVSTSPSPHHRPRSSSPSPFRYVSKYTQERSTSYHPHQPPMSEVSSAKSPRFSSRSPPITHYAYPSPRSIYLPASPVPSPSPSPAPTLHHSPSLSGHTTPSVYVTRLYPPTPHRAPLQRIGSVLRPWIPILLYISTSIGFVIAIAFWKTQVFTALDDLSNWLRDEDHYGYAVMSFLIILTTIPPIPLYSTLIVLAGYTFGPWTGAVISYFAALIGALLVFMASRTTLLRAPIASWLTSCPSIKRVIRAIDKRPKLLFLIRLAPYPYNVMNCLLAASDRLTLKTYTVCTALSLFKVIVHTSLGASIHSFKDYHQDTDDKTSSSEEGLARTWTVVGIILCLAIFIYLSIVARQAVDDELEDEAVDLDEQEERRGFLAEDDLESGLWPREETEVPMVERASQLLPIRHGYIRMQSDV